VNSGSRTSIRASNSSRSFLVSRRFKSIAEPFAQRRQPPRTRQRGTALPAVPLRRPRSASSRPTEGRRASSGRRVRR
jgi:hypothetical protein